MDMTQNPESLMAIIVDLERRIATVAATTSTSAASPVVAQSKTVTVQTSKNANPKCV